MEPHNRFIRANEIDIQYLEWEGDGPPLILLHGAMVGSSLWKPLAATLSRDYRVLAPYLRGHGETTKTDNVTYEDFTADLAAFRQELRLGKVSLVGHSVGAVVAFLHAANFPQYTDKIVLIDPPVIPRKAVKRLKPYYERMADIIDRVRNGKSTWQSHDEMLKELRPRRTYRTWVDEVMKEFVISETRRDANGNIEFKWDKHWVAELMSYTQHFDIWPYVSSVKCPTLIVCGTESEVAVRIREEQLEQELANARLLDIPGAGHSIPMEKPEELAQEVLDFLQERLP